MRESAKVKGIVKLQRRRSLIAKLITKMFLGVLIACKGEKQDDKMASCLKFKTVSVFSIKKTKTGTCMTLLLRKGARMAKLVEIPMMMIME